MKTTTMFYAACAAFALLAAPTAQAEKSKPVVRKKAEPTADEKKADEKKADEKQADEKKADEKKADEKKADEKKADEKKADEKPADTKPSEAPSEAKPADAPAEAAPEGATPAPAEAGSPAAEPAAEPPAPEPPKGVPTFVHLLAPDSLPAEAKKLQDALALADAGRDELHFIDADLSALPADLQAELTDGCRVQSCRTALLAGLNLSQGLIAEMNSSGSSLVLTLFDASGETRGRAEGSCTNCDDDEAKRHAVVAEMLGNVVAPKPEPVALAAEGGGKGPLLRGRQVRHPRKARKPGKEVWAPSVWTFAASGGLAATSVGLFVATGSAHSAYVTAINEGRGVGEIEAIANAGKAREIMAYTSIVLSAGALTASYLLEREVKR